MNVEMEEDQGSDRNTTEASILGSQSRGWDPLNDAWVNKFIEVNDKTPADANRQDRLFSLLFSGSGSNGSWTGEDWSQYLGKKNALWPGKEAWGDNQIGPNFDRFMVHLQRLADQYGNEPQKASVFSRAVGLIWGGIAYDTSVFMALTRAAVGDHLYQLHEGTDGWIARYVDDTNPAHHWAAAFLTGFCFGATIGIIASTTRDLAQYLTGLGGTREDISLGIIGARHGGLFRRSSKDGSKTKDPYMELFNQMRHDLSDNG